MTWPTRYNYVCAIEGIDTLLTDGAASDAVAAWSGTDWSKATAGVFFDLDQVQSAHPWEPFTPGGTLTLTIPDDDFGVLVHRSVDAAETELVTGVDRDDTTIVVQDTTAFASSGTIHIGTEAMSYDSKTSTTFTVTRGKYSPFGCDASGSGTRYAHNHRVGYPDYAPPIAPKVTQHPREWVGRWVGLWRHGWSGSTMQTKAEAQLVFAGRIAEVRDDPATLSTVIVIDHALTSLKESTIGRDFFSGTVADGIFIPAGATFQMNDTNTLAGKTANDLVVVSSGATGTNQMNEGFYTHDELYSKLNEWWAGELAASRLYGAYRIGRATIPGNSERTKIYWSIPGSASGVKWWFRLPKGVSIFFGFNGSPPDASSGHDEVSDDGDAGTEHHFYRDWVPMRTWIAQGMAAIHLRIENLTGAFQEQYDTMPAIMKPGTDLGLDWGLFILGDDVMIRAAVTDNGDGTLTLTNVFPMSFTFAASDAPYQDISALNKRIDDPEPIRIRQIFVFEMPFGDFINRLFYSSGTPGYNHGTYDDLPYGCALGWPGELMGSAWETSVANMPGADKPIAVMLDKSTKIPQLLGSDMVLRHVFPVWKSGGMRMATWQTPATPLAIASLTEDNKAEPSGRDVDHRTATLISDRWTHSQVKIRYGRDLMREHGGGGEYHSLINIEDRTAIDDAGDRGGPFTIDARNVYSEFESTGSGIQDLVYHEFIPVMRMFAKSIATIRRSISADQYDDLAPGDVVLVSDNFARDPTTGKRGVAQRPALIIRHAYNPGGARPNSKEPEPPVGEVELMLVRSDRTYAYSPSALVSSYTSGTKTITVAEHEYSESSEDADVTHFSAGDAIRIIEVDPDDPTNPLTWTRNISSIAGNDIVHDGDALAGYDGGKTYRIVADKYSSCQATQQDKAFQADDADGLIEDTDQPRLFGHATSTVSATTSLHTDLPELHADASFGDGAPFDVGSTVGLARLATNLIDHKTNTSTPALGEAVSNTTNTTGYRLVYMRPVFLSTALLNNSVVRYARVAPFFRSTDGTETTCRITLCTHPPTDASLDDVVRPLPNSDATFTTSSTTWVTGTAATLTLNVKTAAGIAWLLVEAGYKCETRGVAHFAEQERRVF